MTVHELDISWAATAEERRHLRWELLGCDEVRGVFLTGRDETLAVLYKGDRRQFAEWSQTLPPAAESRGLSSHQTDHRTHHTN